MRRRAAGQQEAYDNFIEWLLESEAQEAYEEYVERKQREYGILAEKKKVKRVKPDNRERVVGVSGVEYWKPKVKTQVYPEAKGNPILSNREVRGSILNKVFPDDEVFFLLFNKDLEKYGITNGEVYIKGQIIKKLINYRRELIRVMFYKPCVTNYIISFMLKNPRITKMGVLFLIALYLMTMIHHQEDIRK